jgi:N-acetylglucosaminyl-diphospho-decaprenol L-rhamnosyltransferase
MISLLIVNFRSATLAANAVRSARATTTAPLQVVIVDNTCDPAEAEALRGLGDELIVSSTNRGYAGGINAGRPACAGDTIVIGNPDVTFGPGALDELHAALAEGHAAAGPALFWDDAHTWILPPGDRATTAEKVDEVIASRSPAWLAGRDRRRFRARLDFWSLHRTTPVKMLSGAIMAIRSRDFDAVGGFDERFRLYFEETDFLRRIAERRKSIVYVPAARCRHMYNQSAGQAAEQSAAAYAESELRYLEKWTGPLVARVLKRLERPAPFREGDAIRGPIAIDRDDVIVEASPLPTFATAAGHLPRAKIVDIPDEVWASIPCGVLYLRTVDTTNAEVLATYTRYRT